jgi:hypothetical protein
MSGQSGHVFQREGKRGGVWYAKYRLSDGRQVQARIGPHWSDRKQEPPAGNYAKASARAWLDDTLAKARRGGLHMVDRKKVFGEKFGQKIRLEDLTPETVEGFRDRRQRRAPTTRQARQHRRVLSRGGLGAGSSCDFRARQHDLPHGRVHRASPRRAARAALARRGFR